MEILINNLYICWVFLLVFAIIYLIRAGFFFAKAVRDENVYILENIELVRLGVAISYFLTYIIWLIIK